MMADNGVPQAGEAAAKVCVESFLRRPSLKSVAMQTICSFMNHAVLMRQRPEVGYHFDAAIFFAIGEEAVWLVSGEAAVLFFRNGKLLRRSAEKVFPSLGEGAAFQPEVSEPFRFGGEKDAQNALLLCSGLLSGDGALRAIEESFEEGGTPEAWLKRFMPQVAPESSALGVFLPPPRRGLFH